MTVYSAASHNSNSSKKSRGANKEMDKDAPALITNQPKQYVRLNNGSAAPKSVSFEDNSNNSEYEDENEESPLLHPQRRGPQHNNNEPPPPPPPPDDRNNNNGHNRNRSVGAIGAFFGATQPPAKASPKKQHERTKSLEEWADMFGISGITDPDYKNQRKGAGRIPKQQTENNNNKSSIFRSNSGGDEGGNDDNQNTSQSTNEQGYYHNRNQQFLQRAIKSRQKPPLAPKPSSRYDSPSSAYARKKMLDSIVESEQNESDESLDQDNDEELIQSSPQSQHQQYSTLNDDSLALHDSMNVLLPGDDTRSIGTDSNSNFSFPQHLTNHGYYSGADDASASSVGSGWTSDNNASPRSSYTSSNSKNTYQQFITTERLVKFEQEQEEMFQEKKHHMERELSSVLERNAVKSHREKQEFINVYMMELEKERARLVAQWKEEWEKEEEFLRQRDPKRKLMRDLYKMVVRTLDWLMYFFSSAEVFVSNMPLTIAALALSWVSMGCCWFKFMEENVPSCHHVHFYSPQCTFPEFPGCFECDLDNDWYKIGLHWHYFCSSVSFVFCSLIMVKAVIAWDVVVDELSNPTTSTPLGVFCVAMVTVFAGRGTLGEVVVLVVATCHFLLAFWFLWMALVKYRLYPDPGWFPNTVGISYAAVKSFLYFPVFGEILMGFCLTFFLGVFFISVIRVATNEKISTPICWFMLSAPSITLYAVTLISQPTAKEEEFMNDNPDLKLHFLDFLHHYYMPLQHFLFASSIIGVCSGVQGVWSRWDKFKHKAFSPAHVAFCAPTLAHANAIQSYRASLQALSVVFPAGGLYLRAIYVYWCFILFAGTTVNIIFTYKFLRRLPEWTKVDIRGEEAPPAPYDTMTHDMLDHRGAHETFLSQPFVSPAVLEANEAGALVRVRRGTEDYRIHGPFVRTRKVTARGFDLSLNDAELREERARLLEWVAKNAPRKRHRTMSVPGIMHLRDKAGRGVYGSFSNDEDDDNDDGGETGTSVVLPNKAKHARSKTSIDGFW